MFLIKSLAVVFHSEEEVTGLETTFSFCKTPSMAFPISAYLAGFRRKPFAPASIACSLTAWPPPPVSIITGVLFSLFLSSAKNSNPDIPGISLSVNTISNFFFSNISKACSALSASVTSLYSRSSTKSSTINLRTGSVSSTTKILIFLEMGLEAEEDTEALERSRRKVLASLPGYPNLSIKSIGVISGCTKSALLTLPCNTSILICLNVLSVTVLICLEKSRNFMPVISFISLSVSSE